MNIDPGSFVVYGAPWMMVGAVIIWVLTKYFQIPHGVKQLITALWAVAGYIFIGNLQAIESWWPAVPDVLPQVFMAVLIFGSMMGFQPGETAGKVSAFLKRNAPMTLGVVFLLVFFGSVLGR